MGHLAIAPLPGAIIVPEAVRAYHAERIARYRIPKHITLIHTLPRTGSGKVVKADLRALLVRS